MFAGVRFVHLRSNICILVHRTSANVNESKRMTDPELVSAFLERTSRLSDPEAAALVGVTHTTIARWKAGHGQEGGWKNLQAATRRAVEDYLEEADAAEATVADYNEDREEAELARAGALPEPLLRIRERESIAAVIRAQGMRDACRAARLEAEKAVNRGEWARPPARRITPMEPPKPRRPGEEVREAS